MHSLSHDCLPTFEGYTQSFSPSNHSHPPAIPSLQEKVQAFLASSPVKTSASELESKLKWEVSFSSKSPLTFSIETHQQAYISLTRRFSAEQQQAICEIGEQRGAEIDALCEAAQKGDLEHPVFDQSNKRIFPSLALAAFKLAKLSLENFSDILMYYTLLKYHDKKKIRTVKLFTESGAINQETKKILKATMYLNKKYNPRTHQTHSNHLNSHQFTKFYDELKKLSPLQQQFWIVEDLQKKTFERICTTLDEWSMALVNGEYSISQFISKWAGINTFSRAQDFADRMIPTLSLAQAYLNARHEYPVKLEPIIGFGNVEDLHHNGLNHTRIVSFAFPFAGLEDFPQADGCKIKEDYDMFYHDAIYHGNVVSAIPPKHRVAFIILADTIRSVCLDPRFKNIEDLSSLAEKCFNRFVDMDYANYNCQRQIDPVDAFFGSLDESLPRGLKSRMISQKLLIKKGELGRKLTLEEVRSSMIESQKQASQLLMKLNESTLMQEIGNVFVKKMSQIMNEEELKTMLDKSKFVIFERYLARNQQRDKNQAGNKLTCKEKTNSKTFLEAIFEALKKHLA